MFRHINWLDTLLIQSTTVWVHRGCTFKRGPGLKIFWLRIPLMYQPKTFKVSDEAVEAVSAEGDNVMIQYSFLLFVLS